MTTSSFLLVILSSLAVAHGDSPAGVEYEWNCPAPCSTEDLGMECDGDDIEPGASWVQELEYSLFTRPDTRDWDIRVYNTDEDGSEIKVSLLDAENFDKMQRGEDYESCTDVEDLTSARQCIIVRGDMCAFTKDSEGEDSPYRFVVVECLNEFLTCPISYRITRFTDFIDDEPCKVGELKCGAFGGVIGGLLAGVILLVCLFCFLRRRAQASRTEGVDMTQQQKADADPNTGEPVTWHGGPGGGLPVTAC